MTRSKSKKYEELESGKFDYVSENVADEYYEVDDTSRYFNPVDSIKDLGDATRNAPYAQCKEYLSFANRLRSSYFMPVLTQTGNRE